MKNSKKLVTIRVRSDVLSLVNDYVGQYNKKKGYVYVKIFSQIIDMIKLNPSLLFSILEKRHNFIINNNNNNNQLNDSSSSIMYMYIKVPEELVKETQKIADDYGLKLTALHEAILIYGLG